MPSACPSDALVLFSSLARISACPHVCLPQESGAAPWKGFDRKDNESLECAHRLGSVSVVEVTFYEDEFDAFVSRGCIYNRKTGRGHRLRRVSAEMARPPTRELIDLLLRPQTVFAAGQCLPDVKGHN